MQYIEYLTTDAKCWFDTGIIPDFNTKIEVSIIPLSWSSADIPEKNWNGFIGAQNNDDAPSTFQIRNNSNLAKWSARVGNGNGNVGPNYTRGTQYTLTLDKDYFTVDGTQYGTGASSMDTCNYSLFISAINNSETSSAWALHRAAAATFYYVKVWKNDVLVGEFLPAINNGSIGFYDTVSQSFKANLGTGTPVAGPILSSIIVEASKTTLAAAGDTSNITITCDNAWTVSGNTFLTLSSTGDTGSTTITATAPSYSGATARTDTLTFTDSVTGDEVEVSIKQKKYTSGQPFYLGADEIAEIYLGADSIAEAYLGEDLVYSSGPFMGLKIKPKEFVFNSVSLTSQMIIKSSEPWSITTPAWVSASSSTGDTGETTITLTATAQTATTVGTINVTTANYSASASVNYYNVEFVDYVYENSGSYQRKHKLDTGIPHTASTMTVQLKYKARGGNSDRMVGYQEGDEGCKYDTVDFRIFGNQNGTFDYQNQRRQTSTAINNNGQAYNLTIGDCFCYDNTNETYLVQLSPTGVVPSPNCHIYVDMSYIKVKEVKIMDGNNVLFDGKAARMGNQYGLFDTVGGNFLTSNDFVITGETSNKTLTISNMGTINGDVETKQITIDGNMSVSVENDGVQETFSPVSTAGYTSSYSNGTITISGPFGNTASLTFYYSTNTAPCLQTNQAETVTFVNNAASTAFDDSVLYTDQECECYQQGGTWDGSSCTYPEPEDPCIADPCMCDPNPDECYCIQQGGTWDGSQCIMPE